MNENGKISALYSWPVIVLALFFFWPLGLFLIIRRVSLDKKAALSVGRLLGIIGGVSYGIAAIGFLACIFDGFIYEDIVMILFFVIAGFALRKVAKKTKTDAENVKQYLAIIVNGNVRQLDAIAAATGRSYDTVKADIKKMLQKGYLKNAYINESTREIVLPDSAAAPVGSVEVATSAQAVSPVQATPKVIVCHCCGANNTIYSASGECEYCGSPIK